MFKGVKNLKDPKFSPVNEVRFGLAMSELFRNEDENALVNGTILVFDCTGMGVEHITQQSMDHNKKMTRIYQVSTFSTKITQHARGELPSLTTQCLLSIVCMVAFANIIDTL